MSTSSILTDAAVKDVADAKPEETLSAVTLTVEELARVGGGRKVNEYEGQHR